MTLPIPIPIPSRATTTSIVSTTPSPTTPTANNPSLLLSLPGELRNEIYTLALTSTLTLATTPSLAHPTRTPTTPHETQQLTKNPRLFRRTHNGLTQTNQQLRSEFLPLYRAAVSIRVRLTELHAYMETFVQREPVKRAQIVVEIHDAGVRVEVRDVLLLCAAWPGVRIVCAWARQEMHRLVSLPERYGVFYAYVREKVERVVAVPRVRAVVRGDGTAVVKRGVGRLEVFVRSECAEEWMGKDVDKLDVNYLGVWRRALQVPDGVEVVPRLGVPK